MRMPMVDVRKMRMHVHQHPVFVPVFMRLTGVRFSGMRMLVMLVMDMRMGMFERVMPVLVLMMLGQVQPDAPAHQPGRQPERQRG